MSVFQHPPKMLISEQDAAAAQPCLTLCDPMDCSPPGSSVPGILQAEILEWVAMSSSRGSSHPRDGACVSYVSCSGRQVLYCKHHLGSLGEQDWKRTGKTHLGLLGECVGDAVSWGQQEGRLLLQDQPAPAQEPPNPSGPESPPSQIGEEVSQAEFLCLRWKGCFPSPLGWNPCFLLT